MTLTIKDVPASEVRAGDWVCEPRDDAPQPGDVLDDPDGLSQVTRVTVVVYVVTAAGVGLEVPNKPDELVRVAREDGVQAPALPDIIGSNN